jgi:hypothetical protein
MDIKIADFFFVEQSLRFWQDVLIPIKCGVLELGSQVRRCGNWEERAHEMVGAISDGDSRVW